MTLRVIINADDCGYSEPVNQAIFSLLQHERITSATLLANGPAIDSAAGLAKSFPPGTFGVHLNATEFKPLTDNPDLRPLLRDDGEFARNVHQVRLGIDTLVALKKEWIAQIERLREFGIYIGHIDSHHQVHTIPALFPVLKAVQKRFGIRRVRSTMNLYPIGSPPTNSLTAKKWVWAQALRTLYRTTTTQYFTSVGAFMERRSEFVDITATIELMAHPGNDDYDTETELLETDWRCVLRPDLQLIRYTEL